jgi:hypothetical protein
MNEASSELLADANDIVREQLALAWREHVERVRDVLEAQWPERMERAIEETIAGMAARLEVEHQDALAAQLRETVQSEKALRRDLFRQLNQSARRMRHFENESQWGRALVDATRSFCGRAALFLIRDRKMHLEASRNIAGDAPTEDVALEAAPAFASAVDTRDTLSALRTRGELSETLANFLGESSEKCWLLPVVARDGVNAVLYADGGELDGSGDVDGGVDIDGLELVASLAGAVAEERPAPLPQPPESLITIATLPPAAQKPEILSWFSLSREDKQLHLHAQRFARVQVAGIRLYQSEKVKNGRTSHDLYTSLKEEIDVAREAFRREFLNASDSMVDYLHLELVRTLANDDVELLGQDYPGPMV